MHYHKSSSVFVCQNTYKGLLLNGSHILNKLSLKQKKGEPTYGKNMKMTGSVGKENAKNSFQLYAICFLL